jgi:hypothetical protein
LTCAQLARRPLIRKPLAHYAGPGGEQVKEISMQENVINKIYIDGEFVTPHGNDTNYGLQAYVFSSDPARAHRVASRLEAGRVAINGGYEPLSPFGGSSSRALGGNTVPSVLRAFSNRGK